MKALTQDDILQIIPLLRNRKIGFRITVHGADGILFNDPFEIDIIEFDRYENIADVARLMNLNVSYSGEYWRFERT